MVPTLFQQEIGYVPLPDSVSSQPGDGGEAGEPERKAEDVCPEGAFGFIGRDYDILRVERALRDDKRPWVLLTGVGGAGKTELGYGFARWYAETGGCPGGVFVTSFKESADLAHVIASIAGYATDFSRLPEEQQCNLLVGFLRDNPCLLIWDNLETVAGHSEGAEPMASPEERVKLSRFLKALKGGKSRVLLTSRQPEEKWLNIAFDLLEVRGLNRRDAAKLATAVLVTVGCRPEDFRTDPLYLELLGLLRGHPRSLQIVLPLLRTLTPAQIVENLQHTCSVTGEVIEDVSLTCAFFALSERTRALLPVAGLFTTHFHTDVIVALFSSSDQEEASGKTIAGIGDIQGWHSALAESTRAGLIRSIGADLYELHPTLPPLLRQHLVASLGTDQVEGLDAQFAEVYAALSEQLLEGLRQRDPKAIRAIAIEQGNLRRAIQIAEESQDWKVMHPIAKALEELYSARGQKSVWHSTCRQLLDSIGRELSPRAPSAEAGLRLYLLSAEADRALERLEFERAAAIHRRILEYLLSLGPESNQLNIAAAYGHLGIIDWERRHLDEAQNWYQKQLKILESVGKQSEAADVYYQLAKVACERLQFVPAEDWCKKALTIYQENGMRRYAADAHHMLGLIAEMQHRLNPGSFNFC